MSDPTPPKKTKMTSRKLLFAVYATLLMVAVGFGGAHVPAFVPMFDTVVGGIVAVVVAYFGGNIASKWVFGKGQK